MSFLDELDRELAARHVPAPARRRIALELGDHIASDPGSVARLGDPRELARSFAAERAADDARRTARNTFLALCLAAAALVVGQLALGGSSSRYPGFDNGTSTAIALTAILMIVVAPQVALVAGLLAAWRAIRRRGVLQLPDAEVALIHRRCAVAAAAGLVTCAGLLLYVVNFTQRIATWWLVLQGALALLAAAALIAAVREGRLTRRTTPGVPGPAGGIADDVPPLRPVLAHPLICVGAVTIAGLVAGTVLGGLAEHSLIEGVERGTFEALVIAAGLGVVLAIATRLAGGAPGPPPARTPPRGAADRHD